MIPSVMCPQTLILTDDMSGAFRDIRRDRHIPRRIAASADIQLHPEKFPAPCRADAVHGGRPLNGLAGALVKDHHRDFSLLDALDLFTQHPTVGDDTFLSLVPRCSRVRSWIAPIQAGEHRRLWSLDFVSDQMTDGRRLRILTVIDNCTRECLGLVADTSLSGRRAARELDAKPLAVVQGADDLTD